MVEPARDLPGDLHVGVVVLAHRDGVGLDAEDVGGLQDRVAQQPVGHLVFLVGVAGHVLQAGDAFQARHRDQVLEERVEFADLRDGRLQIEGRAFGLDARGQGVEHHLAGVGRDLVDVGAGVLGGEHVQISDDEPGLVLVLQLDPVGDAAHVVAQVQLSGGPVTGEHPLICHGGGVLRRCWSVVDVHARHGRPGTAASIASITGVTVGTSIRWTWIHPGKSQR